MILYVSTRSSSLAARLAFALSGLPGDVQEISLRQGEGRTPEYLALNPKGQVPTLLLDDGQALTETPAILLAIGEMAPESGLIPTERMARWRVMEWLSWCAWHLPRSFHPGFAPGRFGPASAESEIRASAVARVEEMLAFLDRGLEDRDWIVGEAVTAADCYIALVTVLAGFLGVAPPDALLAHRKRLFSLPVLADTLAAEGFSA
ncbi:glutathione S-transferase family protein [Roseococcus sp. SYP-B2431]|uniref:glutathione S-transferase family protein n=1 Tax=Roseococcus sp. SYP-B2431 TaxID=2496640 RepID=UPI00103D02A5|nr:glutathione S-transferase family protein [Roseococcus sp. SYP-B2431]TCH99891.1 glutathione S-transferase family protein [Roseococcus sp. SYP-B2431]